MAENTADVDAQDSAEAYDETLTDGEAASSDAMDLREDGFDATSALGDDDLDDSQDAYDADEEGDDLLDSLDEEEFDEADDEGEPSEHRLRDQVPGQTGDTPPLRESASLGQVADYESDTLSDEDLAELDYTDAPKAEDTHAQKDARLDDGVEETYPASDPVAVKHIS